MDQLDHMFELQTKFQTRLGTFNKILSPADKQAFINQMILALVEESVEIMRETPYKNPEVVKFGWKKNQLGSPRKCLSECVDLFHFLMNIVIVKGYSSEDFYNEYCKKNGINHDRQDSNY